MKHSLLEQVNDGILTAIGNTPLIRLQRCSNNSDIKLFAKLEMLNPSGSIKDRPAINMLRAALESGEINLNTTIIDSSSGNLGIGIAQTCAYLGLKFICVTDALSTEVSRRTMQAYGAKIELIEKHECDDKGSLLATRIKRVQQLLDSTPNSFNCNQYNNLNSPRAYYQVMQEILQKLDYQPDYIFCAVSTCGTLLGCAEYIKQHNLDTKIIAVDAKGSVIFGKPTEERLIPGHGASIIPPFFQSNLASEHVLVSDLDCIVACRKLAQREGIFSGGSSGGVMAAILKMQDKIPTNSTCVAIFSDQGGRYIDTIYNDDWVKKHFGNVSHLWEN